MLAQTPAVANSAKSIKNKQLKKEIRFSIARLHVEKSFTPKGTIGANEGKNKTVHPCKLGAPFITRRKVQSTTF
ncbi:hypothetical protein [Microbulbifer sp. PSTR4-B]|uniref:hypothetical protein n=1 Tax=Microbulbifer sp. PSTR4-B TaxID=3243396 RepID=UPI00403A2D3E